MTGSLPSPRPRSREIEFRREDVEVQTILVHIRRAGVWVVGGLHADRSIFRRIQNLRPALMRLAGSQRSFPTGGAA